MTQEEKQLLIQDICARLPYKIRMNCSTVKQSHVLQCMFIDVMDGHCDIMDDVGLTYAIEDIKPYLRPMSSMTEEEKEHLQSLHNIISDENYEDGYSPAAWETISEFNDYCHEHHLDNRGLISKGLALKAPEGMYKAKTE